MNNIIIFKTIVKHGYLLTEK